MLVYVRPVDTMATAVILSSFCCLFFQYFSCLFIWFAQVVHVLNGICLLCSFQEVIANTVGDPPANEQV